MLQPMNIIWSDGGKSVCAWGMRVIEVTFFCFDHEWLVDACEFATLKETVMSELISEVVGACELALSSCVTVACEFANRKQVDLAGVSHKLQCFVMVP